eukprot:1115747-Amphidinium_carterae.1
MSSTVEAQVHRNTSPSCAFVVVRVRVHSWSAEAGHCVVCLGTSELCDAQPCSEATLDRGYNFHSAPESSRPPPPRVCYSSNNNNYIR